MKWRLIVSFLVVATAVIALISAAPGGGAQPVTCGGLVELPATIVGTEDDDVITRTAGDDVISGLGGDDVIYALDGNDVVCGGPGDDVIYGGPGADDPAGGFIPGTA